MRKNYHFTGALGHWFCCTCVCFPFVICLKNVRIRYKTDMKEEKLEKIDGKFLVDIFGGNAILNIPEHPVFFQNNSIRWMFEAHFLSLVPSVPESLSFSSLCLVNVIFEILEPPAFRNYSSIH